MIDEMLQGFRALPDIWGEGAIWAFSGLDGRTNVLSGFVATLGSQKYNLLFHIPLISSDRCWTPRLRMV